MPKGVVENNGELGGRQLKKHQKLHDTASTKQNGRAIQSLTERIKKRNNQEKPSWDHSKPW